MTAEPPPAGSRGVSGERRSPVVGEPAADALKLRVTQSEAQVQGEPSLSSELQSFLQSFYKQQSYDIKFSL